LVCNKAKASLGALLTKRHPEDDPEKPSEEESLELLLAIGNVVARE
jgi:hypothetical protein